MQNKYIQVCLEFEMASMKPESYYLFLQIPIILIDLEEE